MAATKKTEPKEVRTAKMPAKPTDEQGKLNTRLWFAYQNTPLEHTKPVQFGRKFTAIDAHYQLYEMTQLFGPLGQGWGYDATIDVQQLQTPEGKTQAILISYVTVWYIDPDDEERIRRHWGPVMDIVALYPTRKGGTFDKLDEEAAKKVVTGALTKAISQLGFNHDVFFGAYDDNKYMAQLETAEAQQQEPERPKDADADALFDTLTGTIQAANDVDLDLSDENFLKTVANDLTKAWKTFTTGYQKLERGSQDSYADAYNEIKEKLGEAGKRIKDALNEKETRRTKDADE